MGTNPRSHDRLLGLIQQLYAAPGNQEGWATFLDNLCTAIDGYCAHFISVDQRGHAGLALTVRSDPVAITAYEHWGAFDPWGHSQRLRTASSGSVVFGEEMIPHAQLLRTAFYADFGRPYDLVRCVAGTIETAPEVLSVISVGRTEAHSPFETDEGAFLSALMPHLRRALQLHRRIATAEAISDNLIGVLDGAIRAVFIVNETSRVVWMNRVADQLIAARDGIVVDDGELRAVRGADTSRLRALLGETISTSTGNGTGTGGALLLGRPTGRRPLMALVAPLTRRLAFFANPHAAVVIVTDPERLSVPDEATLRELFGLTPAEARLTCLLVQGATLGDAAAQLGLRIQTVRTRLKGIFEKTGTHRQADLVRLVLQGRPTL